MREGWRRIAHNMWKSERLFFFQVSNLRPMQKCRFLDACQLCVRTHFCADLSTECLVYNEPLVDLSAPNHSRHSQYLLNFAFINWYKHDHLYIILLKHKHKTSVSESTRSLIAVLQQIKVMLIKHRVFQPELPHLRDTWLVGVTYLCSYCDVKQWSLL